MRIAILVLLLGCTATVATPRESVPAWTRGYVSLDDDAARAPGGVAARVPTGAAARAPTGHSRLGGVLLLALGVGAYVGFRSWKRGAARSLAHGSCLSARVRRGGLHIDTAPNR